MGSLCSKPKAVSTDNASNEMTAASRSMSFTQSTFNILHSFSSASPAVHKGIGPISGDKGLGSLISRENGKSILSSPKQDELKLHTWLRKRGHVIRNWRKRYFVLTSNSLKYYMKPSPNPPFGESLCGEIYLRGAVIEVKKNSREKTTWVEITGRKGEKDLTIELSSQIDNEWINALEWTIRRCSKSYIEKVLNSNQIPLFDDGDSSYFDVSSNVPTSPSKRDCHDWVHNEKVKYEQGLLNLSLKRSVPLLVYQYGGRLDMEPCEIVLWSVATSSYEFCIRGSISHIMNNGKASLPSPSWSPRSYGLQYCLSESKSKRGIESEIHTLSFYDINNIREFKTQLTGNEGLGSSKTDRKESNSIIHLSPKPSSKSKSCKDYACPKVRNKMFCIDTSHGHSLDVICCCMYDHQDFIYSLRNVLLYLRLKVPHDECLNPKEEVDDKVKAICCYSAKMKLEKAL